MFLLVNSFLRVANSWVDKLGLCLICCGEIAHSSCRMASRGILIYGGQIGGVQSDLTR